MNKKEFKALVSEKLVILDGATGTELSLRGMPQGVCPEKWILDNPSALIEIQQLYKKAGSMVVYAPTFGGNRFKLEEFGLENSTYKINRDLALLSKKAVGDAFTFGDLAPTGRLIEPFGDTLFEDTVSVYKEQVRALLDGGVDGFVIETMLDIQEARAALLAVRDLSDLPVMVSMTYGEDGRTLNGTDPVSALMTLQSIGADAVGCNCSTGPADMIKVIRAMKPYAKVPLIAKPNAGMPRLKNGKTVFDMTPEEFASYVDDFVAAGVNIFGGCCGTTPEHIAQLALQAKNRKGEAPQVSSVSAVSSSRKTCFMGLGLPFNIVGERINPTGKKTFQAELRSGKTSMIQQFALDQARNGATILDVNMGLSGIDEKEMMLTAIKLLARTSDLPLCIDTTNPEVMEAALRLYPGRALVNSISAEKERIEKTLPIAAKYGAMFILLPLTDEGIPATCEGRKKVVRYVLEEAAKYQYSVQDIAVDGLVMTISSDQQAAQVTLDLIEWCSRDVHINTICGLSNVSFGLPERKWVNTTFLSMAISRGLSMAIANPSSELLMATVYASDALTGRDNKLLRYINAFSGSHDYKKVGVAAELTILEKVYQSVLQGDENSIGEYIEKALEDGSTPKELVDNCLIPAITTVGDKFDKKEYFLPQLIMSADTMRKGFQVLEPHLKKSGKDFTQDKVATVLIATVKGDIHDIGKNIVALMLRNYNFDVIDLGKDVAAEDIIRTARDRKVTLVALSALMTTTMVEMKEVIALAKKEGLDHVKFMIGGAVVDQNYADEIGADGYAADAMEAVKLAQKFSSLRVSE